MPYKCTVCGKIYLEGSEELKEVMRKGGCDCGKKFLMYVRSVRDAESNAGLSPGQDVPEDSDASSPESEFPGIPSHIDAKSRESLRWLEREFMRMREQGKNLNLGIETIRILEEGKYRIDVASLMRGKPIIVRTEDGVYYIDLANAMKKK